MRIQVTKKEMNIIANVIGAMLISLPIIWLYTRAYTALGDIDEGLTNIRWIDAGLLTSFLISMIVGMVCIGKAAIDGFYSLFKINSNDYK